MVRTEEAYHREVAQAVNDLVAMRSSFEQATGARLAIKALHDLGAFAEPFDGFVGEWFANGGTSALVIQSRLVFPPADSAR